MLSRTKMSIAEAAEHLRELFDRDDKWGEHPVHIMTCWRHEVACGETRQGYWEWVALQLEGEKNENEES